MKLDRNTIVKAVALALFLLFALYVVHNPAVRALLQPEHLQTFVSSLGAWGPLAFMCVYALAVVFLIPATVLTAAGAVLFGPIFGTMYAIVGATIGAIFAFWIARTLGRGFAEKLVGGKLKTYDDKLEKNGFATIFYLRMILFPFIYLNYGAGLTKVKFKDYLFATLLGIIPATFIITFFVSKLSDVFFEYGLFSAAFLAALLHWDVLLAIVLFGFSFFIPTIVHKIAERRAH